LPKSVFIAGLFVLAAKEMIPVASHRKDGKQVKCLRKAFREIVAAVHKAGWDGEWFRRAYDDFASRSVRKSCEEGQIFH